MVGGTGCCRNLGNSSSIPAAISPRKMSQSSGWSVHMIAWTIMRFSGESMRYQAWSTGDIAGM